MALQQISTIAKVLYPMENTNKLQKDVMIESMFSSPAPGGVREYRIGPLAVCKAGFRNILGIGNNRINRLSTGGPDDRFGPRARGDPRGHRPEGFSSVYSHLWHSYNSVAEFMPDTAVLASAKDPTKPVPDTTRKDVLAFQHVATHTGPFGPGTDKLVLTPHEDLPIKHLPPGSKRDHWWTYLSSQSLTASTGRHHASYSTFKRVWRECFEQVLKIRSYGKFTTCTTCCELKQKMHAAATHAARCKMAQEYALHLEKTWRDRQVYWRMRGAGSSGKQREAGMPDRDWLVIIVDGADQAKFRIMKAVEWPKAVEGEHRPKMKVTGALAHGFEMSFNFIEENVKRGSNLVVEVLARCLDRILSSKSLTAAPPHLWVQADNAGGENKNVNLMRFLSILVDRAVFRSAVLSFLQVGHTHEDIDGIFGMMSKGIQQLVEWDSPQQMSECLGPISGERGFSACVGSGRGAVRVRVCVCVCVLPCPCLRLHLRLCLCLYVHARPLAFTSDFEISRSGEGV